MGQKETIGNRKFYREEADRTGQDRKEERIDGTPYICIDTIKF